MKTRNKIGIGLLGMLTVVFVTDAYSWCPENEDWPDAPCYAPYQHTSEEFEDKLKEDWVPYYDYKGEYWMEQKRYEMEQAIQNNSLEKWLDLSLSHRNVHYYYYLQGEAPDLHGNRIFTCDLYVDIKRYDEILKQDTVLKKFLQKFPRSVSSYDGIDESRPPQSQITYEYNESGVHAALLMRVFEGEDKEPCIVPIIYTLTYNDKSIDIEIRNFDVDVSELLQFLDSLFYQSPLKQFNSGISINEIQCRNSLQIMLMYDGTPACVKPESIDKLKQRGFSYVPVSGGFHIEKDCNKIDGRAEAQCFKEAFDTCTFAKANSVIHTIEGDAMYLESIIKADCKIHTTFDNTGDRYWGPTAGITKDVCNNVELEEDHVWIIDECTSEPEFQINYMGQDWELYKKCREISGTWNSTYHNCMDFPNLDACKENGGNLTCMSYEQMGHGRDVCRNVCNFDVNEVDRK